MEKELYYTLFITKLLTLLSAGSHILLMNFNWFVLLHLTVHIKDMVCQNWFDQHSGTLKIMAEGNNVDTTNCAAPYRLVNRTAGRHHTFCSPFTLAQSSRQFCRMAKWFMDMKIICAPEVSVHKHDFHSPGQLSFSACKRELTQIQRKSSRFEVIFEVMILNEIFKTMSILKAETKFGPLSNSVCCLLVFWCFSLFFVFCLLLNH